MQQGSTVDNCWLHIRRMFEIGRWLEGSSLVLVEMSLSQNKGTRPVCNACQDQQSELQGSKLSMPDTVRRAVNHEALLPEQEVL